GLHRLVARHAGCPLSSARATRLPAGQCAQSSGARQGCRVPASNSPLHCRPDPDGSESPAYVTTTDSAQVTPGASGPVAVTRAERVGARAPAAVMAERRAWLLLWLAFATFCALVFAAAKFTVEYVRTAEVDQ